MVFWLISAAIKASCIQKVENRDTSHIHKLSIQKGLELHTSIFFLFFFFPEQGVWSSRIFNAMVEWAALNSYPNKSSQPKRKLLLFPSGFTPHYYIRIRSQDYKKKDNAIPLDHFQMRTLPYQNVKKIISMAVGEGYTAPYPKSLLQSVWLIFKCHFCFLLLLQMHRNKAATCTNKMKPLTYILTLMLPTTLNSFHKGTCTAVICKLLESSGTRCCDLHNCKTALITQVCSSDTKASAKIQTNLHAECHDCINKRCKCWMALLFLIMGIQQAAYKQAFVSHFMYGNVCSKSLSAGNQNPEQWDSL